MSFRIELQLDQNSESTKWIVTIRQDGKSLKRVERYGGPEICDALVRSAVEWLGRVHGYPAAHYWTRAFPDSSPEGVWEKRPIRPLFQDPTT